MNDSNKSDNSDNLDGALDADIVALLADASTWVEPPSGLSDRVVAAVRSEAALGDDPDPVSSPECSGLLLVVRGSARRWLAQRARSAFLFGGIIVLSALSGAEIGTDAFSAELTSTGLVSDVGGNIDVTSFDSGLRIDLDAPGLPRRDDGKFYEGWMRTADGDLLPVGTFHEGSNVTLWAGVELDRIELFTITLEEAAGGNDPGQGSSGEVVLRTAIRS